MQKRFSQVRPSSMKKVQERSRQIRENEKKIEEIKNQPKSPASKALDLAKKIK